MTSAPAIAARSSDAERLYFIEDSWVEWVGVRSALRELVQPEGIRGRLGANSRNADLTPTLLQGVDVRHHVGDGLFIRQRRDDRPHLRAITVAGVRPAQPVAE